MPAAPHGSADVALSISASALIGRMSQLNNDEAIIVQLDYALSNGPVRRSVVPATLAIRLPARVKRVALWA